MVTAQLVLEGPGTLPPQLNSLRPLDTSLHFITFSTAEPCSFVYICNMMHRWKASRSSAIFVIQRPTTRCWSPTSICWAREVQDCQACSSGTKNREVGEPEVTQVEVL